MNCSRCRGLMIATHFLDYEGGYGEMWASSWRGAGWANCGYVYDPVVGKNNVGEYQEVSKFPSSEPDYGDEEVHLGADSFHRLVAQ